MKFNFRCPFSGVLFALALCLFFVTPISSYGETASKAVASFLRQNGLREGYDASLGRFIMVGDAMREISDVNAQDIFRIRDQLVLRAALEARNACMEALDAECSKAVFNCFEKYAKIVTTTNEVGEVNVDEYFPFKRIEMTKLSSGILPGCTVLRTEESYNDKNGAYEVAIVAMWDVNRCQAAIKAFSGSGSIPSLDEDMAVWSNSIPKIAFSHWFGPLQNMDSDGNYRFFGVGCATIGDGTDAAKAREEAAKAARRNLAYSLWSEKVAFDLARQILDLEVFIDWRENEEAYEKFFENFYSKVEARCQRDVPFKTIFEGETIRPLTGRKMRVCVVSTPSFYVPQLAILKSGDQVVKPDLEKKK